MKEAKPCVAWLLCAVLCASHAEGARILGVFAHIGKSHWDFFEPLMRELARRGHEVTVISHFPLADAPHNYTDISLRGSVQFQPVGQVDVMQFQMQNAWDLWNQHLMLSSLAVESCEVTFSHPEVQKILKTSRKFDLLISELFNTNCFLAFAHHFKIPVLGMSSCTIMPWYHNVFGNSDNPAYIPNLFQRFGVRMGFWERLQNTFHYPYHLFAFETLYNKPSQVVARKYFGADLPPLDRLAESISLLLLNSHYSLSGARPQVPAVREIAGIHIPKKKPLPKDLQQFMDGAEHGVIYFNMGSMIRGASFSDEKRQAFLEAFSQLPQRVLWKWEEDQLPGQSENVRISKWLPQYDVLRHPKVRVYIGHGGLLGSIEAAETGVPMIVMPVFGDQRGNAKRLQEEGMALQLDFSEVTTENVLAALRSVLYDPKYADSARRVSRAFHDRPLSPLEEAVFWTEFVLRHPKEPGLLHSSATLLAWYERALLDVAVFLAVVALLLVYASYWALCRLRFPQAKTKSD